MIKFGFKIKTRGGMIVDNLQIGARDQAEAEIGGKVGDVEAEHRALHHRERESGDGQRDHARRHAVSPSLVGQSHVQPPGALVVQGAGQ